MEGAGAFALVATAICPTCLSSVRRRVAAILAWMATRWATWCHQHAKAPRPPIMPPSLTTTKMLRCERNLHPSSTPIICGELFLLIGAQAPKDRRARRELRVPLDISRKGRALEVVPWGQRDRSP